MSLKSCSGTPATSAGGSVMAIVADAALELVGCYAWSPDKAGVDVGELCGIDPSVSRQRTTWTGC